nr:MAG TPA: hypothetical protein [Inoviridae sp.]
MGFVDFTLALWHSHLDFVKLCVILGYCFFLCFC